MRPISRARGVARVAGAALLACGLVFTAAGVAGAVDANPTGPEGVVVTNYGDYPNASQAPAAGCADGNGSYLDGIVYTVERGVEGQAAGALPYSGGNLSDAGRLYPGDQISVHWGSFLGTEECAGAAVTRGISLALKSANAPTFDIGDDQALLFDFAYCGGAEGATSCEEAGNTLTLTMPDYGEVCNYQIDFVIGGPLNVVGPNGSYYGNVRPSGGANMLLGANNGGPGQCATVTKTVDADSVPSTDRPPADKVFVICLTPTGGDAVAVEGQCPEGSIQVELTDGQEKTVPVTPGTIYDVSELLDTLRALGPVTISGPTQIDVTNQYQCIPDEGEQVLEPADVQVVPFTVVIDLHCTTTTSSSSTTSSTTSSSTTTPPCLNCDTTTTASTIATTTTAATTTVATTVPNRGTIPDETVEGTTVNRDVIVDETLPVTGNNTWPAARIGILMVLSGAAALALSKRRRAEA